MNMGLHGSELAPSPLHYLLLPTRNSHRQVGFPFDVAYLSDYPGPFLNQLDNALVKRINLLTASCQPFFSAGLYVKSEQGHKR